MNDAEIGNPSIHLRLARCAFERGNGGRAFTEVLSTHQLPLAGLVWAKKPGEAPAALPG